MSNQGIKSGETDVQDSGTKARVVDPAARGPRPAAEVRARPRAKGTQPAYPSALAEVENALRGVFAASPHGMAVINKRGTIQLANSQFSKLVGAGENEPPVALPAECLEGACGHELLLKTAEGARAVRLTAKPIESPRGTLVVLEDVTDLKEAEERLAHLATTDDLTGLPNLRAFRERLMTLTAEAERGRRFAVVFADVDHFKHINDRYGHTVGNEALAEIASALRGQLRETDMVARFGGEEFCALLVDCNERHAMALAERLRAAVAAIAFTQPLTASFGVCAYASDTAHPQALIRAADQAMLRAKESGRNRVVGYHD